MELKTLKVDRADGIVTITPNRPEKKNALNPPLHSRFVRSTGKDEGGR